MIMNLKTLLLFACFAFRIYFTSAPVPAPESENVIGPKQCILNKKSNIVDAKKLKKQYLSEGGVSVRRVWRGDDEEIFTLQMDKLQEICQCFAEVHYDIKAELSSITANTDFLYRTKLFLLSWFGYNWNEYVVECEVPGRKFYVAESEKFSSKLYHRNVYIFEISKTEWETIGKSVITKKWIIDYPKGEFKALYPEVHMKMYLKENNVQVQ